MRSDCDRAAEEEQLELRVVAQRLKNRVDAKLPRFSPEEMVDILSVVAELALKDGSRRKGLLKDVAGRSYGDARLGVALLRHMGDRELKAERLVRAN